MVGPPRSAAAVARLARRQGAAASTSVPASVHSPRFSPDGRTLAFVSEESGRAEVYLAATDGSGAPRRLSRSGGLLPRFRADGRELVYFQPDGMLVSVDPAAPGAPPRPLFRVEGVPGFDFDYDVAADGQRFLVPRVPRARGLAGPAARARLDAAGWRTRDALTRGTDSPGRVRGAGVQNLKRAVRPNVRGWLVR